MPTDKNKVSAYVPDTVYHALIDFQKRQGLPSISSALGQLLTDTLLGTVSHHLRSEGSDLRDRVAALEAKVGELESKIEAPLQNAPTKKAKRLPAGNDQDSVTIHVPDSPNESGLSQKALCERYNLSPKHVSRNAKRAGQTAQEWVESQTGWNYRNGKYYPPVGTEDAG